MTTWAVILFIVLVFVACASSIACVVDGREQCVPMEFTRQEWQEIQVALRLYDCHLQMMCEKAERNGENEQKLWLAGKRTLLTQVREKIRDWGVKLDGEPG